MPSVALDPERVRRQPRPGEAGIDDVFPAVGLVAELDDVTGEADLGALRIGEKYEGGLRGSLVPGEPARAETQILAVLHDEGAVVHDLPDAGPGIGPQPGPVRAHVVSAAVAARVSGSRSLRVVGAARGAIHLDLDGFIVSVTGPGVPWMPNGIAVGALGGRPRVMWDAAAPPLWDPVVRPLRGGRPALDALRSWLSARVTVPDIALLEAPAALVGRGPGLTPKGDDILAGAAIGVRALGAAGGLSPIAAERLARALSPGDLRRRTGSLSATLLELAVEGAAPEPVHRLIGDGDRGAALGDLRRLGASTGGAIAAGIALAAEYLMNATASA